MDGSSQPPDETGWMVPPPGRNELTLTIGVGDGVELSPEIRQAVDLLIGTLISGELAAVAGEEGPKCGGVYNRCSSFSCVLDTCNPFKSVPCAQLISCKIQVEQ